MSSIDVVDHKHAGKIRVEIDLASSKVRLEDTQVLRVELWLRLLLGSPEMIGGKLVYPVEMTGVGTFDRRLHGDAPDEQIGTLVLKRALDTAWRGASVLVDVRPTTPLELSGLDVARSDRLTGILKRLTS